MQGFKSNQEKLYALALYAEQNCKEESVKALLACGYEAPFDDIEDSLICAVSDGHDPAINLINKLAEEQGVEFHYLVKNKASERWNLLKVPKIHFNRDYQIDANGSRWEVTRQYKSPFQTF